MKQDPVTGDKLTRLEYYTRQVQSILRTPWFIVAFQLTLLVAALTGHLDAWNYFASALAVDVEWIVGTYFFGQTGRDAVIIRAIRAEITEKVERMEAEHGKKLDEIRDMLIKQAAVQPESHTGEPTSVQP